MEDKKKTKKAPFLNIKLLMYLLSFILLLGSIIYGLIGVSEALPVGFSAEALLTTLRLIREMFLWPTLVFLIIGITLIVKGATSVKMWYLLPVGIALISIYWLIMNIMTIKMVVKIFSK
jgi:hypothetical protein